MTALQDAIREAGPQAVAAMVRDNPDFRVFGLLFATPEELIAACDAMEWQTLDELLEWVRKTNDAIGNTASFVNLIAPPIPFTLAGLPTTDMPTIHAAIAAQCKLTAEFRVDQSDINYRLLSKSQWELLAKLCPINRRGWVAETMDCDDYVNAFRGWLASHGLGNLAQGFGGLTLYDLFGGIVGGHAVVIVMDDTHKLWYLDPQPGKLYPVDYARLGGFITAKTVRVARAFF